jgi:hypothetical protein
VGEKREESNSSEGKRQFELRLLVVEREAGYRSYSLLGSINH